MILPSAEGMNKKQPLSTDQELKAWNEDDRLARGNDESGKRVLLV